MRSSEADRPEEMNRGDHRDVAPKAAGELSRREALGTTAKVGVAAAAAGLLGAGAALPAFAAAKDTTGKGKFTGWAGLSQGEVNVLRKVVLDSNFRAEFVKSPKTAIKTSGEKLTNAQSTRLARMTKLQTESFVSNMQFAMKEGGSTGGTTTYTLWHAVAFAVVMVILLAVEAQEGSPTANGAVPLF